MGPPVLDAAWSLGPVTHEKASRTRQATLELNRMCIVTDTEP